MTTRVLVPLDTSECSTAALEFALESYPDAKLIAVHVIDPADIYGATGLETGTKTSLESGTETMADYEQIRTHRETQAEAVFEEARNRAVEADVDLETEVRIGDIPRTILAAAEDQDVDQIVLGSHGRTGASRILLGSVAETVGRRSPVPVTIVR